MVNEERITELADLFIPATTETPEIKCEKSSGRIMMVGNLIPSDPQSFLAPIHRWLQSYVTTYTPQSITVEFYLTFINGCSEHHLGKLLKYLEDLHINGMAVKVICHYENEDLDMKEWGKDLSMALRIPIELVEIN
jgi:hypothetical protein